MTKFILAILLVISTFAVVAHGILVYHLNAVETLIAEEESSDNKTVGKEGKDDSKEHIPLSFDFYKNLHLLKLNQSALDNYFTYSKGFYNKPYNPPKAA